MKKATAGDVLKQESKIKMKQILLWTLQNFIISLQYPS